MKKRHIIAVAAVVLGLAAGVAYSAIPSSTGTITACKANSGTIKIIDAEAGEVCPSDHKPLSWNVQGPAGPQGPPGVSGWTVVSEYGALDSSSPRELNLFCPEGKEVLSGGGTAIHNAPGGYAVMPGVAIVSSLQTSEHVWHLTFQEIVPTDEAWSVAGNAACADLAG